MTLEKAIIHAETVAKTKEREAKENRNHGGWAYDDEAKKCSACAAEHRQLAEWLKELKAVHDEIDNADDDDEIFIWHLREKMRNAISTLQVQDVPDTNVGDMVSRQTAIDTFCRRCDLVAEDDEPCTEKCNDIKILEKLPSAQPEIIHCKDCKHWREGTTFSYCDKLHEMGVLDALDYMTAEDDYCSMAERREE